MKKLILIIFSFVFLSNNVVANDKYLNEFNKWLIQNNHTQYLEINKYFEECKNCNRWDAGPQCFEESEKPKKQCVLDGDQSYGDDGYKWEEQKKYKSKLKIKFFKEKDGKIRDSIPWNAKKISDDTLLYYGFVRSKKADLMGGKWLTEASSNPYEFEFDLREDKKVDKELKKSAMMSYLLFENGKITVDEKSPEDRFGILLHEEAKLFSSSVGKTIVSYVLGNAVCEGYIDGVNSKIDDWPLIKNTLYDGQKIIDVINMSAGDQEYINIKDRVKKTGKTAGNYTIKYLMEEVFKNSTKKKQKWNYSGLPPHLINNYIWFKSNGDYQKILDKTFKEKAKIKHSVQFRTKKYEKNYEDRIATYEDGILDSHFWATRYDYLRIAKAILDDWQNDTCVGKYLKTVFNNRVNKNYQGTVDNNSNWFNPKQYAGFFHTGYTGMKDRAVMGMDGNGGQSIMIDFDRGRIIVINAIHNNYNWKKIAHSVIKKGK